MKYKDISLEGSEYDVLRVTHDSTVMRKHKYLLAFDGGMHTEIVEVIAFIYLEQMENGWTLDGFDTSSLLEDSYKYRDDNCTEGNTKQYNEDPWIVFKSLGDNSVRGIPMGDFVEMSVDTRKARKR